MRNVPPRPALIVPSTLVVLPASRPWAVTSISGAPNWRACAAESWETRILRIPRWRCRSPADPRVAFKGPDSPVPGTRISAAESGTALAATRRSSTEPTLPSAVILPPSTEISTLRRVTPPAAKVRVAGRASAICRRSRLAVKDAMSRRRGVSGTRRPRAPKSKPRALALTTMSLAAGVPWLQGGFQKTSRPLRRPGRPRSPH